MSKRTSSESARNQLKNLILSLRSEVTPERFKRSLVNFVVSVMTDCPEKLSFPEEVREERAWTVNEFYRYSTSILAGLYDAVFAYQEGGEGGA